MLEQRAADMIAGVNEKLHGRHAAADVVGGHGAAVAAVELMRQTMTTLPPMDIIAAFEEVQGRKRIPHMWSVLGERAITCVADGALCLANVWESAWREGGGSTIDDSQLQPIDRDALMRLYNDPTFLPALELPEMEKSMVLR